MMLKVISVYCIIMSIYNGYIVTVIIPHFAQQKMKTVVYNIQF